MENRQIRTCGNMEYRGSVEYRGNGKVNSLIHYWNITGGDHLVISYIQWST